MNEECRAAMGLKFVNFLFSRKMSQQIVFNLAFNKDSKMGAIFVPFVF